MGYFSDMIWKNCLHKAHIFIKRKISGDVF